MTAAANVQVQSSLAVSSANCKLVTRESLPGMYHTWHSHTPAPDYVSYPIETKSEHPSLKVLKRTHCWSQALPPPSNTFLLGSWSEAPSGNDNKSSGNHPVTSMVASTITHLLTSLLVLELLVRQGR